MTRDARRGRPLRLDSSAESADSTKPAFLARPENAPVYHGFSVIPETETDGWVYGAISDFDTEEPETEGDGFVIAPDGSRAGVAWATDTGEFYEISPPDAGRWGVYGVCFPRPVSCLSDIVENFRAVLPLFQARYREIAAQQANEPDVE